MRGRVRTTLVTALLLGGCGAPPLPEGEPLDTRAEPEPKLKGTSSAPIPPSDSSLLPRSGCVPGVPATPELTRLTNRAFDNTVRDLLGLDDPSYPNLAPESSAPVDDAAVQAYAAAASALASQLVGDADARARVLPCDEDTAECIDSIVRDLGARAWRRPLPEQEVVDLVELYAARDDLTETGSYDEALELIVRTLLSSPSFYHRVETPQDMEGGYYVLSSYEVAARLSYMLWESMPDAALFDAAANDLLRTPEGILEQAYRLLDSPRAHGMVAAFHERYAAMGPGTVWETYERDPDRYPRFSPDLPAVLAEETARVFDTIVFRDGSFQDLLLSPLAFVNAASASVYDLDPSQYADDLAEVELLSDERPGVFTRAGFLASHGYFDATSPTARGGYLLTHVLCVNVGPPHPGPSALSNEQSAGVTNRQRIEEQNSPAECRGCHALLDPPGFALEAFDAIGAAQTSDNGAPIDTTALVLIGPNTATEVDGAFELMTALADSPQSQRCYATWWVEHAYGRRATPEDLCVVDDLAALIDKEYSILDVVAALTQTDSFRLRVPTDVAPERPSGPPSGVQADVPPPSTSTGTTTGTDGRLAPGSAGASGGGAPSGAAGGGTSLAGGETGGGGAGSGASDGEGGDGADPPSGDGTTGLQSLSSKSASGCGCRVGGTSERKGPMAPTALALLGAFVALRRRRAVF